MKKQRSLHKILSLLLCLCMVLPLVPAPASANYEPPTQVVVAGTDVFAGGYWLNDGSGGITSAGASASNYNVAFQKKSDSMYVLTLNGADISKCSEVSGALSVGNGTGTTRYSAGIWSNGTLYIELIGDSTVDLSGNDTVSDTSCAALYIGSYNYPSVYPYLTFSGAGNAVFKGGSSGKNSCGIYSISNAIMNGTGTVTAEGGTCGAGGYYGYGSYGIYLGGTADDYASCVGLNKGNVVAVGANGGKYSYGVYGKISFPKFDTFAGGFTAYSADSTYSAALSQMPLYEMNASDRVLVGSTEPEGTDLIAFDPVYTNMYRYLTVKTGAQAGASVTGTITAESWTSDSLTVTPVKPSNGSQEVEYAIGTSNSADKPTRGWQTDTTFIGLVPNTYYKVWARTKASADCTAGPARSSDTLHVGVSSYGGGLYIDGVDLGTASGTYAVAGGTAVYDYENRTVTLSGTMNITHGTTIPNGTETAVYGIFTNSQQPFTIVLADGADVTIDLANYLRDDSLTIQVEAKKNVYRLTGKTVGIRALCGLTIEVPEGVQTVPTLTINVTGTTADGIRSGLQSSGAGQNYPAPLRINAENRLDMSVTATSTGGMASPIFSGAPGTDDDDQSSITISCRSLTAVITERSFQQEGAAIYPADRSGTLPADMTINSGTVTAKVLNHGGEATAVKMYMNKILYGDDTYTAEDENGNILIEDAMKTARTLIFRPNNKQDFTGTVVLSGAFRVGTLITAELRNSNVVGTPVYTWYRVADDDTETKITSSTSNTYVLAAEDKDHRIYCTISCPGRKGTIQSDRSDIVQESVIPSSIYINGYEVTAQNCTDVLKDGTVYFNPDTGMLYLNNTNMQPTSYSVKPRIYTDDDSLDLTICLIGSNVVASDSGPAIKVKNVTFVGDGTLTVSASGLSSSSDDGAITADALRIGGTCKITSTTQYTGQKTFSATRLELAENAQLKSTVGYVSVANLDISDKAYLESTSAVSATTTNISGNGSMNVVKAGSAMSGSEIVLADNAALTVDNSAYEGSNTVALAVKQITTSGNAKLTVRANLSEAITSPGTSGNGTTFIMEGGTVDAQNVGTTSNFGKSAVCMGKKSVFSGGTFTAYSRDYYGIYLTTAATDITVSKGVSFTGKSDNSVGIGIGIRTSFTAQGNGTINAVSKSGSGLSAPCALTVDGGLEIHAESVGGTAVSVSTMTLDSGTIGAASGSGTAVSGERIIINSGSIDAVSQTGKGTNAQLIVNGGTVHAKSTDGDALYRTTNNANTALTLNSGTVHAESTSGMAINGAVKMQVGTLRAESASNAAISGNIQQTGGTLSAHSETGDAIVGTITLSKGEMQAKTNSGTAVNGQITQNSGKLLAESVSGLAISGKISLSDGTLTAHSKQNNAAESNYSVSVYGGRFFAYSDRADKTAFSGSFSSGSHVFASQSPNGSNIAKITGSKAELAKYPYVIAAAAYEPYIDFTTNYVQKTANYDAATKTATVAISVIADQSRTDNWRIAIVQYDKNGRQLGMEYLYISFEKAKTYTINGAKVKMWPNKYTFSNVSPTDTFKVFVLEKDSRTPVWPVATYQFS